MRVLTGIEMKTIDEQAIQFYGDQGYGLMDNAALGVADVISNDFFMPIQSNLKVAIVCGPGHNGGDGIALAKHGIMRGWQVSLFMLKAPKEMGDVVVAHYKALKTAVVGNSHLFKEQIGAVETNTLQGADVVVDCLFGFSLNRTVEGLYLEAVKAMNQVLSPVYSLDVPSGVHSDFGQVMGAAVQAKKTVTFTCPKVGMYLYPGAFYTGEIQVCDIGVPTKQLENYSHSIEVMEDTLLDLLPLRRPSGHKGTFGRVVIIAGSKTMCGAAILAAKAAYRTGCGLVHVITEKGCEMPLFSALPEALVVTYEQVDAEFLATIQPIIEASDSILIGPGLSQGSTAKDLMTYVMALEHKSVVIDADGLNLLSQNLNWLEGHELELIITPHVGEMSRLTGHPTQEIIDHIIPFAQAFLKRYQATTVLKSGRTVVSVQGKTFINPLGHSGMATAGSGDVLAGMIVSLLAQGCSADTAAVLGTYLHSQAAHVALKDNNLYSLIASDIIEGIRLVMK